MKNGHHTQRREYNPHMTERVGLARVNDESLKQGECLEALRVDTVADVMRVASLLQVVRGTWDMGALVILVLSSVLAGGHYGLRPGLRPAGGRTGNLG